MANGDAGLGNQFTVNFRLEESTSLVDKIINKLAATKIDQAQTLSALASSVRGGLTGSPSLGGVNIQDLKQQADAVAAKAADAEKLSQEVQSLSQQILTNITQTLSNASSCFSKASFSASSCSSSFCFSQSYNSSRALLYSSTYSDLPLKYLSASAETCA